MHGPLPYSSSSSSSSSLLLSSNLFQFFCPFLTYYYCPEPTKQYPVFMLNPPKKWCLVQLYMDGVAHWPYGRKGTWPNIETFQPKAYLQLSNKKFWAVNNGECLGTFQTSYKSLLTFSNLKSQCFSRGREMSILRVFSAKVSLKNWKTHLNVTIWCVHTLQRNYGGGAFGTSPNDAISGQHQHPPFGK